VNQARLSIMVEGPSGKITEQVYTFRYYRGDEGATDYQWSVQYNPVSRM